MYRLDDKLLFPNPNLADTNGLLAYGGDLSPERLLLAYSNGIFPWYNEDPILWWSPRQRFVLFPDELKVSKSMAKILKDNQFTYTRNKAFKDVIKGCKESYRPGQEGTWINEDMEKAYISLFDRGVAQSVEVWQEGELVGGFYGVVVGEVFCGESMFSKVSNASKAGFITFVQSNEFKLIDCQVYTEHLESFGARYISRRNFLKYIGVSV